METLSKPLRAPAGAYAERLRASLRQSEILERRSAVFGNLRGFAFLAAAALAALTFFGKLPRTTWIAVGAMTGTYAALVVSHDRVLRLKRRFLLLARLNERGIARLTGEWHRFAERGDQYRQPDHLYAEDLDIFGQGSLFQLVNETATRLGESVLAGWLARAAAVGEVRERQAAVRELAGLIDFRQEVLLECQLASAEKADPRAFIAWAEGGPYLKSIAWARPLAWLIRAITASLIAAGQWGLVPPYVWLGGILLALLLIAVTRHPLDDFYSRISAAEMGFVGFGRVFERIDRQRFGDPLLKRLSKELAEEGASAQLRRFARLLGFAELRQSRMMHAVIDALVLWDLHVFFRLERWREQVAGDVRRWFQALAELEALFSLATLAH
ncbi:MAG TPA: DNA mismatch repair protein MutS, partial [Myxococcaceae bacterium]|nr:DNA mismatch repair protein MutS [Myxococcaceae bacterium]